jgi:hypothetical protein
MTETNTTDTLLSDTNSQTGSWYAEEQAELVNRQGWKNPSEAVRDYGELLKSASGKVKLPGENSSPDEISNFYKKNGPLLGVPDTPDGYEIKDVPDDIPRDETLEGKLKQWAHEQHIPKASFETVIRNYYREIGEMRAQARSEGETTLKAEWKDNYGTNLEIAKRFAKEGGDEFLNFLENTGIGNHPTIIKAFFNYGQKILSDSLIKGEATGEKDEAGWQPTYPNSPEMYAQMTSEEGEKARAWFESRGMRKGW